MNNAIATVLATINADIAKGEKFLADRAACRASGISVLVAHGFAVVTPDGLSAVRLSGSEASLATVRGDLVGTMFFTRADADRIAAAVSGDTWGELVVMTREQLVPTLLATLRATVEGISAAA